MWQHAVPITYSECFVHSIKQVWGDDADSFNPMRFIEDRVDPEYKVGMYGNLYVISLP